MRGGKSAQAESVALVMKRCRGVLLASTALAAVAAFLAPTLGMAQNLDLNGSNVVLPHGTSFGGKAFINGTDNVTNNSATTNATLTEGGGPAGTTYSGSITDGATKSTGLVHTGGTVTILGANPF